MRATGAPELSLAAHRRPIVLRPMPNVSAVEPPTLSDKADTLEPSNALLKYLLQAAPMASMFYSGTLCGVSPRVDGTQQGCLHFLISGELGLTREDSPPQMVQGPCVLIFPRPLAHRVEGLGAAGADLMCATLSDLGQPLSTLIPEPTIIGLNDAPRLRQSVEMMFGEAADRAYGREAAIDRLLQYVLVLVVRKLVEHDLLRGGVIDAMADDKLAAVIEALHRDPGRTWTLEAMAHHALLSRSAFAQRFSAVVGMPPLSYLTAWRMSVACGLLAQGKAVKQVASAVGYRDTSSFSRVFQRALGVSSAAWQQARLET